MVNSKNHFVVCPGNENVFLCACFNVKCNAGTHLFALNQMEKALQFHG